MPGTSSPASDTVIEGAANGSTPTATRAPMSTVPTSRPPAARARGGKSSPVRPAMTK